MFTVKIVSSLEKCFLEQKPSDFTEIKRLRMYKNEHAAIQLLPYDDASGVAKRFLKIEVQGALAPFAKIRWVESVACQVTRLLTPDEETKVDKGLLNGARPGLYPDILMPTVRNGSVPFLYKYLKPVWIDFEVNSDFEAGKYPTEFLIYDDVSNELLASTTIEIEVLPLELPKQKTKFNTWIHFDCVADYYEIESFSDLHFEYCEKVIAAASRVGQNMVMVPVFTPPLDTVRGGERTTTQLVKVNIKNGKVSFDFSLVDRWIDICNRHGIKYLNISPLFTQWGAANAPKIMATVDGEYKRIFGWETDAGGEEYVSFLRQFLSEFIAYLEARGDLHRAYFHISDEPFAQRHFEQYNINVKNIGDLLEKCKVFDAMSHVDFYRESACKIPVVMTKRMEEFMSEDMEERWVYYCGDATSPYASSRFLFNTLSRTRSIGMQLYKYEIDGFAHWGFNYYNNEYSHDVCNPYLNMCSGYWGIAGDANLVYPGRHGEVLESIRFFAIKQAFYDIRVLELCESYYGRERVIAELEAICGPVNFQTSVDDSTIMNAIRDKMDDLILAAIH